MATTGRLTATQRAAIQAGAPIRQEWDITVPTSASHAAFETYVLDSGFLSGPNKITRVVQTGSRAVQVWNPSLQVKKVPKAVRYSFTISNEDGKAYTTTPDNIFKIQEALGYQAEPAQCEITHRVLVMVPDPADYRGYSFSEITHMTFTGRIINVRYLDTAKPGRVTGGDGYTEGSDGTTFVPAPATAIITCEQLGAWETLRRVWTLEDGTDHPMTNNNPGGMDFTWNIK